MNVLWAPWRAAYVRAPREGECFLCVALAAADDRARLILRRGKRIFIVLNAYPYNSGHLMVAPYRHAGRLEALDAEERLELMDTLTLGIRLLEQALRPDGFNVGLNLGRSAGAGLDDHLHVHIVPRWVGDTNFMPVLAAVKVLPEHLEAAYDKLSEVLARLGSGLASTS